MRISQAEKMEIIRIVESSPIGVKRTLKELKINRSTFYNWYGKYLKDGFDGLANKKPERKRFWNQIPQEVRDQIVDVSLELPDKSPREIAMHYTEKYRYHISESSVYRILKQQGLILPAVYMAQAAADEFKDKTTRVNEMWQTDFTYFKILGWGWYYLSTILDDYSRYIVSWRLCKNMKKEDVQDTIKDALLARYIPREERPRLLSDNGSCYIAKEFKTYLHNHGMDQVRGAANHPQTQGKIERYHRSMKIVLMQDNYFTPEQLEVEIKKWVNYYNNERYHESLSNLTPSDVYHGRSEQKLRERAEIKRKTMKERRRIYQQQKAAS
jgi:transposase InsO family protein